MDAGLAQLIKTLELEPLPGEGGLYREAYRSSDAIPAAGLPDRYPRSPRPFGTAIYYLLTDDPDSFSALHRLPTDEIYHFYLGDPVEMLLLHPDSDGQVVLLGQDVLGGQQVQFVVPAGCWQGSRLCAGGRYALMGTTMAPGFSAGDYEPGRGEELCREYPHFAGWIRQLARE